MKTTIYVPIAILNAIFDIIEENGEKKGKFLAIKHIYRSFDNSIGFGANTAKLIVEEIMAERTHLMPDRNEVRITF